MKIVVLDGHTLNPGDLSWEGLYQFGEVSLYERSTSEEVISRSKEAEIVISNKVPFRADTITQLPHLQYIGVSATGYDIIDIEAARRHHITVTNIPAYGIEAVAQHTFALILALSNQVGVHQPSVLQGDWQKSKDWCYWKSPLTELQGKTLGIIGFGKIGQKVAQIALAFGMKIIYYNRSMKPSEFAQYVDLDTLFQSSDIISLHAPLQATNKGLINAQTIAKMKTNAWLINTARGGLIQESDLAQALNEGRIGGAALDVLQEEPPRAGSPLIGAKNTIITPHNAWCAREARQRLLDILIENLRAYLGGNPQHVVN